MIPIRLKLLLPLAAAAAFLQARAVLAEGASPTEIRIAQHRYQPRVITVSPGTTLRWVNEDEDPHTVTADGGAFASRERQVLSFPEELSQIFFAEVL